MVAIACFAICTSCNKNYHIVIYSSHTIKHGKNDWDHVLVLIKKNDDETCENRKNVKGENPKNV